MAVGPPLTFETGVTGTGLSAFSNLLQEGYEPILNEKIMNKQVVLFKAIGPKGKKMTEFEGGQRFYGASITGWPEGVGSRREGAPLPYPYSSIAINPIMYLKDFYARARFTGNVERTSSKSKGSWANAVKIEIKNLKNRASEAIEHQLIVGKYGILGQIDTNLDTTTSTAMVMLSGAGRTSSNPLRFGTQFLRHNQEWRATVSTGPDYDPIVANTGVDTQSDFRAASSGLTFTWTTTTATTAGTVSPRQINGTSQYLIGNNTRPRTNGTTQITADQSFASFHGLMEIVDASGTGNVYTTLYGLTRSTTPQMNAVRSHGSGVNRELSEAIMTVVLDRAKNEGPGGDENVINQIFCHDAIRFRYANLLTATRQFMSTDGKNIVKGGGFEDELTFTGGGKAIPMTTGKDFPPGSLWCVALPNFRWLYQTPPGFLKTDGIVRRWVAGLDATEVAWHLDGNLYCEAPNANAVIDDINFSTTDYTV